MPEPYIEEEEQSSFSLRDIYFVVFRHKKCIVLLTACGIFAALGAFLFLMVQKSYTSEAKLLVRVGRESVAVDRLAAPGEPLRNPAPRSEEINTEIEILKNIEIAKNVVNKIGIDQLIISQGADPEIVRNPHKQLKNKIKNNLKKILRLPVEIKKPETIEKNLHAYFAGCLLENLDARQVRGTSVLSVSFTWQEPVIAKKILENFISCFLTRRQDLHFTQSSYEFLLLQTDSLNQELKQTEEKIRDIKKEYGFLLSGNVEEEESGNSSYLLTIEEHISDTESALAASKAKLAYLQTRLSTIPVADAEESIDTPPVSVPEEVYSRLYELRLEEQRLLSTFTEQSVPVQEIRRQIQEVEKLAAINSSSGGGESSRSVYLSGPLRERLTGQLADEEANIEALEARLRVLRVRLTDIQKKARKQNDKAVVLAQLERKREIEESNFKKYAESLEQARIDQALKRNEISNISISQEPTSPLRPDASKARLALPLGIIGGLVGGIALSFFFETLDHTVKRPEEVKKTLGSTYLVSVPHFNNKNGLIPDISRLKNLITLPEKKPVQAGYASGNGDISEETRSYFETLLHRLLFSGQKYQDIPHVIGVTSCRSGEGASTVATNLAVNLARVGKGRILLADMKLLKFDKHSSAIMPFPNLGNMLALRKASPDGCDGTSQRAEHGYDEMHIMHYANGKAESNQIEDIQDFWKKEYDFVVMDLPAILDDPSVTTIARLADEVIVVVESERERSEVITTAIESMNSANVTIKGIILNKRRYYIPDWLYKTL